MDLHPLQTPSSILTDCLNGTFITYNGNEHVLQNDMGNFKLKKCKLKENYIPVGTASYGDILYIASYNPIEDKFELGSYPSPMQWEGIGDDSQLALYSILEVAKTNIDNLNNSLPASEQLEYDFLYSDLTTKTQSIAFTGTGFKLEPGDKYKLDAEVNGTIEHIDYFIVDNNQVEHLINPIIGDNNFNSVEWQIPGYLGVKNKILTPYSHKVSLKSANVKQNTVVYTLSSRLFIMDEALCTPEKLNYFLEGLCFSVHASTPNETFVFYPYGSSGHTYKYSIHDWLGNKKQIITELIFVLDYADTPLIGSDEEGNLTVNEVITNIDVLPIFNEGDSRIMYDNLQKTLSYTVTGDYYTKVAEDDFYWTKNEDTSEYTLHFDIQWGNMEDKIYFNFRDVRLLVDSELASLDAFFEGQPLITDSNREIVLSSVDENTLYLGVFKIEPKNDRPKYVGRFFCLHESCAINIGRVDIEKSLNPLKDSYLVESEDTYNISFNDLSDISFSDEDFNKLNLNQPESVLSSEFKNTNNGISLAATQSNPIEPTFDDSFTLLNGSIAKRRLYSFSELEDKSLGKNFSALNLTSAISAPVSMRLYKIAGYQKYDWLCFKDLASKTAYTECGDWYWRQIYSSRGYNHTNGGFYGTHLPDWAETIVYSGLKYSYYDSILQMYLKRYAANRYIRLGVQRESRNGGSYQIRQNDRIILNARHGEKKVDESKLFMISTNKSGLLELVRYPDIDTLWKLLKVVDFKVEGSWSKKYLYKLNAVNNSNITCPNLYVTKECVTTDKLIRWMFNGADKSDNLLGIFTDIEYDPNSIIEKLDNTFTKWELFKWNLPEHQLSLQSFNDKIDKWNAAVDLVEELYKKNSHIYYQVEELFNKDYTLEIFPTNNLYLDWPDGSNMERAYWEYDLYKKYLFQFCIKKRDNNKFFWDNDVAQRLGQEMVPVKIRFTVTGSGEIKTSVDNIPGYIYD